MLKKLFTNTLVYGLAPFVPKLAGFFALPIITKDLTDVDFGVFGIITAYVTAISAFSLLGLKVVFASSFYHYPNNYKWRWRQLYGFLIVWMIVFALFLSIIIYISCPNEAKIHVFYIIILNVFPIVFFGPTAEIGQRYYQLNQRPFPIAVRSIVFGLLSVILNVFFISYLKLHYMGWFLSSCIVGVLNNVSYWYVLNISQRIAPIFNFRWKTIKHSLSIALPTIPHFYASYLVNGFERVIMNQYSIPTKDIGHYNMANTFAGYPTNLTNALAFAISPMLMELYKKNEYIRVRNLIFLLESLFIAGTFTICIWMKEIFYLLVKNESLQSAYPLAIILIMAMNYRPIYFAVNSLFIFKEKTNAIWKITLFGGLMAVICNIIFIPLFGYKSVVVSSFMAYSSWGIVGFYLKDFKKCCSERYYPFRWFTLYSLLTILAFWCVEINWIFKILLSVVSCIFAGYFLYKYSKKWNLI